MIHVRFDMQDSRVVYGNPNLRWGDPAYLLEYGDPGYQQLAPGTPGYEAPPKPKRKRRSSISIETLNLPNHMQPFRYLIYLIKGIFTAKPALRDAMTEGEYLDALATRAALTRTQVETLITEQSALHVELARQGIPVDFVLKRFRVLPTCGGRYTSPNPDDSEVCPTLGYSLIVHPNEIDKVHTDCPLEKVGEAGELGPVVESVRSRPGKVLNRYGVGLTAGMEVNGKTSARAGPMPSGPLPNSPPWLAAPPSRWPSSIAPPPGSSSVERPSAPPARITSSSLTKAATSAPTTRNSPPPELNPANPNGYPLTPALSRGRGRRWRCRANHNAHDSGFERQLGLLPLPWGEGWGEGDSGRPPHRHPLATQPAHSQRKGPGAAGNASPIHRACIPHPRTLPPPSTIAPPPIYAPCLPHPERAHPGYRASATRSGPSASPMRTVRLPQAEHPSPPSRARTSGRQSIRHPEWPINLPKMDSPPPTDIASASPIRNPSLRDGF